jgi:Mg-chelatase subunit ChlD
MASVEWIVVVVDGETRQDMFSVATHAEAVEIAAAMRERGTQVEIVKCEGD